MVLEYLSWELGVELSWDSINCLLSMLSIYMSMSINIKTLNIFYIKKSFNIQISKKEWNLKWIIEKDWQLSFEHCWKYLG